MFRNYLKTSSRSIKKNALFSLINIVGLAISMSVGILMIALFLESSSFDNFHKDKDRIYRVTTSRETGGELLRWANASVYIGNEIAANIPGVEQVAMLYDRMNADFLTELGALPVDGFFASESFFEVFSFRLLKGNAATALADPRGVVLTESTAKRLFNDQDPMGQVIEVRSNREFQQGIVTGVLQDPPRNSHLRFEALVSMTTLNQRAEGRARNYKNYPGLFFFGSVYLKLNEQTTPEKIERGMEKIMSVYNAESERPLSHGLQPLKDFVTDDQYPNRNGPFFSARRMGVMMVLTAVVLLSACFNYTNLSMARALRRSKEIGVRKVSGATRVQVFAQFVTESTLISLSGLVLGYFLFYLLRPFFLELPNPGNGGLDVFQLQIGTEGLMYSLLFALITGLLAGFLPAVYLSKLKAKSLVVKNTTGQASSGVALRKMLVVLQFVLSIGLIMSAVMVYKQYRYAVEFDLGYQTENILNLRLEGDYGRLLENELRQIPEIADISSSGWILGVGSSSAAMVFNKDKSREMRFMPNEVDHNYLEMHGFEFLAGEGFRSPVATDETPRSIVVNRDFLSGLDLGSPQDALGESVLFQGRETLKIVGVIDDFISTSLNWEVEGAFGFIQLPANQSPAILNLKIENADISLVTEKIKTVYEKYDPVHAFEALPYQEEIAILYDSEKTTFSIISFLAFLAISISTLGMLGMAVYTTESRMKEIGIRKVLGAGVNGLLFLLSRSFLLMIVVAGMLAIPSTFWLTDRMVLNDFLYRTPVGMVELFSGFVLVLAIGFTTIALQIGKAARTNPADILRNE